MHDNHIHSKFSADSHMEAEEACKRAVEIGLSGLVFTDHVDYDFPDFDESFLIDYNEYFSFFHELKARWKSKLDILIGVEMGYQPQVIDEIENTLNSYSFDFVINSVHIIEHKDPYTGDYFIGKTQEQAYERYLQEILCSVNAYDNYDVIGHIGYAARYGNYKDKPIRYKDYSDIIDEILKAVIEKGKGIELNTSGLRGDLGCTIPGYDVFKRYFELGGEIITIGSDSHYTEHLGHSFNEALEYMANIGFKQVAHFEKRKPVFEKI
ncbi:histidinol-phosphatase HisJ family protein [Ruminiclostridium cellulolyticum]|uniref:Histidinol-phosphatase n=1 Tax=Ruminiclostridium cellulolyticum (strain ATCC 35319 / DSM 5812 / JCM 6584 / H10) TaxID=394503 RepID=B8I3D2_RUMCH|nr:histidinol-phosphatase HisJ family protein [Ruminiclostridium cellulolyticum]ACL76275.1 histidinol phosphate phosphatase HisJ family [Ruminiclostridium cellulolyticum H10]